MMDQKRRLLRVDHLPFLALQMTECNSFEIQSSARHSRGPGTTESVDADDAPLRTHADNKLLKKRLGKVELEACYIGTEFDGRFPDKGALIGDVYDDIPDESDEAVYDALEKAYNAAFSMSAMDKVERDRKFHANAIGPLPSSLTHKNPATKRRTKRPTTAESFDAWKERLLEGRKEAFFAVMKKKALDDIKDYREYFIQQRQRKLNAMRNRVLEQGTNVMDIWKDEIAGGKSDVTQAAEKMDEQLGRRKSILKDLAKRCRDLHLKRQTRLKQRRSFAAVERGYNAREAHHGNPIDLGMIIVTDAPMQISRPREILADNAKVVQFMIEEADMFVELLLGNRTPIPVRKTVSNGQPKTLNISSEEIVGLAEITSSKLFQDHCDALAEYDADFTRSKRQQKTTIVDLSVPLISGTAEDIDVTNPFQNPSDPSKWNWLEQATQPTCSPTKDADTIQALLDRPSISPTVHRQMKLLYNQGINGVLVPATPSSSYHQMVTFLTELAVVDDKWGPHVIVTSQAHAWEAALSQLSPTLKVMPYWGSPKDRESLREYWTHPSLRTEDGCFHIVLTNSRVAVEDAAHFNRVQWHVATFDEPLSTVGMTSWTSILGSLRCRQRWLVLDSQAKMDMRLILHFLAPELFDSKQKIMAWGSAGLEENAIQSLRSIVQRLCVLAGASESALDEATAHTTELCQAERLVLEKLNATPVMEYILANPSTGPTEMDYLERYKRPNRQKIVVDTKRLLMRTPTTPIFENPIALSLPKPAIVDPKLIACKHCAKTFMTSSGLLKHTKSDHAPAGTWTCRKCGVDCGTMALRNAHERQEHDENITPSNKPTVLETQSLAAVATSVSTPPSHSSGVQPKRRSGFGQKKRVTRCGKCAGCLSGDCMECGHCQDMKKYGGPGLRKQSCKNRKCTNPQVLGTASLDDEDGSKQEDMDGQSTESAMSSESEAEEEEEGSIKVIDEEETEDEDALDDAPLKSAKSKGKKGGRSAASKAAAANRTRVMRCGVCVGCLAPDCMKCRHCQDMKKYGGPGLRKQSCKSRKCVTPKVVLLNQGQEEDGDMLIYEESLTPRGTPYPSVAISSYPTTPSSSSTKPSTPSSSAAAPAMTVTPQWEKETLLDAASSLAYGVYYQQMQLNRFLKITCLTCDAKFLNQSLKSLHDHVVHQKRRGIELWQRQLALERLPTPAFQYTLIATDARRKKPVDFEPVGYAKLVGPGLCYYMLQSQAVLGRVAPDWKDRYRSLGLDLARGFAGGTVDCHLGDDMMISNQHARIRWDVRRLRFVIECLSVLAPLSVNGQEVVFGSTPLVLSSRSLVQIGAFYFFFLLPVGNNTLTPRTASSKSTALDLAQTCRQRQCIPRQEIYTWLAHKKAQRQATLQLKLDLDGPTSPQPTAKRRKLGDA
ncbi:Aste57867_3169 [Aphanomyces stellatus]|uniref:Chromatin-remodeling ATPase INO80 n=1 Tax=Aphanomyces stellatus TaxID=120398 RepID=A0A485K952_9STRA|nr:hypothetical protein As57867_003160 [Aphanomyces stellatus]VFT80343.1 Aste57867_3169 [Aphanomyces stellatus]